MRTQPLFVSDLYSIDRLAAIVICLRNRTVDWLILIPGFVSILLLVRLIFSISDGIPRHWLTVQIWRIPIYALGWLVLGFVAGVYAIANIRKNLPVRPASNDYQTGYLKHCLTGLVVSVFGLSTFWAQTYTVHPGRSSQVFRLWWFLAFSATYHLFGWLAGFVANRNFRREITPERILCVIGAGIVNGYLAWLVVCLGFDKLFQIYFWELEIFPDSSRHFLAAVYFCLATPVLLAIIGAEGIFYMVLTMRHMTDESQGWLARFGAWMLIFIFGWAGLTFVILFGPGIFMLWWDYCFGLLVCSSLISKMLDKRVKRKVDNGRTLFLIEFSATVAKLLFTVLATAFLSLMSHWVIYFIQTGVLVLSKGSHLTYLEILPPPIEITSILELCVKASPSIIIPSILTTAVFSTLMGLKQKKTIVIIWENYWGRTTLGRSSGD